MELEVPACVEFSDRSLNLIEKTKIALTPLHYIIEEDVPHLGRVTEVVVAAIFAGSMCLNFKAHTLGEVGQTYLAPDSGYQLTDGLFDGDSFTTDFLQQLEDSVSEYRDYLRSNL